jgi:hypothetical protein
LNLSHARRSVTGVDIKPRERLNARRRASRTASRSLPALRQGTQNEVAVLLQQLILAAVTTVRDGISEVLSAIKLHGDPCVVAEQIYLQRSDTVECNRKRALQPEATLRLRQRLQAPVPEPLGGAACPGDHLSRGFSQMPRAHSFAHAGAYPDFPVFRLSNRRG